MTLLFDLRLRVKNCPSNGMNSFYFLTHNLNSLVTPDPDTSSNNMTTDYSAELCSNSVMGKPNWSSGGSAEVGRY